jgi:hypothetical protein
VATYIILFTTWAALLAPIILGDALTMTLGLGNTVPDPRIRPLRTDRPPVPGVQRTSQQHRTEDRQAAINLEIESFQAEVNARCNALSDKFGLSVRRCKDLLLAAGVHTIFTRPNGSAYNAFLSMKSKELQESKCALNVMYRL